MPQKIFLLSILMMSLFCYMSKAQKTIPESLYPYYQISESNTLPEKQEIDAVIDSFATLIPYRENDKFGFLDRTTGTMKIKPIYDRVLAMYPEGIVVEKDDDQGLIDWTGKEILPFTFSKMFRKEGDYFHLSYHTLVDKNLPEQINSYMLQVYTNPTLKSGYSEKCHAYKTYIGTDTMAWFRYGTHITIRGISGNILKEFELNLEKPFMGICNNLLVFRQTKNESYHYTAQDIKGKVVKEIILKDGSMRGPYILSNHLIGFNNEDGDQLFFKDGEETNYGMVQSEVGFVRYEEGFQKQTRYIVSDKENGRYGVIDSNGDFIIPMIYKYIGFFDQNSAVFCDTNNRYSFRDTNGQFICDLPITYGMRDFFWLNNEPYTFHEGRCVIAPQNYEMKNYFKDDEEDNSIKQDFILPFQYIDQHGKVIMTLPTTYRFASNFHDGMAAVMDENYHLGFIDHQGKLKIPMKYFPMFEGRMFPQCKMPFFQQGFAYIDAFQGWIDSNGKEYFTRDQKHVPVEKSSENKSSSSKDADSYSTNDPGAPVEMSATPVEEPQPEKQVFTYVELMPEFPGGNEKLNAFLNQHIKVPAGSSNVEGKVFVTFVVNQDGSLSDIKILRGLNKACDEEAIRVMNLMPLWKPGKQNGQTVAVRYNLPIIIKSK